MITMSYVADGTEAIRLSGVQALADTRQSFPEEETDAILMVRVKEGDRDAFGDLVGRHKNGVVNYLTHMTRDRDRAEELAQEAFLRLYLKAAQYGQDIVVDWHIPRLVPLGLQEEHAG